MNNMCKFFVRQKYLDFQFDTWKKWLPKRIVAIEKVIAIYPVRLKAKPEKLSFMRNGSHTVDQNLLAILLAIFYYFCTVKVL
jgi:hypothetical protein